MNATSSPVHLTIALFNKDYQRGLCSWSVPVLTLPGVQVLRVRINGNDVPKSNYTLNLVSGQLEWHVPQIPTVLYLELLLPPPPSSPSRWWEFFKIAASAIAGAGTTVIIRWLLGAN